MLVGAWQAWRPGKALSLQCVLCYADACCARRLAGLSSACLSWRHLCTGSNRCFWAGCKRFSVFHNVPVCVCLICHDPVPCAPVPFVCARRVMQRSMRSPACTAQYRTGYRQRSAHSSRQPVVRQHRQQQRRRLWRRQQGVQAGRHETSSSSSSSVWLWLCLACRWLQGWSFAGCPSCC